MLSVFITPCMKPTAIQCAISSPVRRLTSASRSPRGIGGVAALGAEGGDHVVGELPQFMAAARRPVLEGAEADENWARHGRPPPPFDLRGAPADRRRPPPAPAWSGCRARPSLPSRGIRGSTSAARRRRRHRAIGVRPAPLSWISQCPRALRRPPRRMRPTVAELPGPDAELSGRNRRRPAHRCLAAGGCRRRFRQNSGRPNSPGSSRSKPPRRRWRRPDKARAGRAAPRACRRPRAGRRSCCRRRGLRGEPVAGVARCVHDIVRLNRQGWPLPDRNDPAPGVGSEWKIMG